uniref:Uncharacterized protein n=1 Tax=Sphaerodactylus townsendi TaxID=933632 RepID=A0ACB8EDU4_9SAUR
MLKRKVNRFFFDEQFWIRGSPGQRKMIWEGPWFYTVNDTGGGKRSNLWTSEQRMKKGDRLNQDGKSCPYCTHLIQRWELSGKMDR